MCTWTCSRARWAPGVDNYLQTHVVKPWCRPLHSTVAHKDAVSKVHQGELSVLSNAQSNPCAQVEASGEGAVWVERAQVDALNAAVRRAGERKLALMTAIKDFKKGTYGLCLLHLCLLCCCWIHVWQGARQEGPRAEVDRTCAVRRHIRHRVGVPAAGPAGCRPEGVNPRAAAVTAHSQRAGMPPYLLDMYS